MKMYILVRDDIPLGFAMVATAHASLAGYLKFQNDPEVQEWLTGSFLKAVCKVNAKEFANAKKVADHVVLTESALGHQEVAIVFRPRPVWPTMFKFFRLYREESVSADTASQQPVESGAVQCTVMVGHTKTHRAPSVSYRTLTLAEFAASGGLKAATVLARELKGELFSVSNNETRLYPEFQLEARMDGQLLTEIASMYKEAGLLFNFAWDFLRSVHKPLGKMTGVEFLMTRPVTGEIESSSQELRALFIELAEEDIARLRW